MLHFVQHDKPGRSLVIVDETAVTQHHLWLLPSPARARRAFPLPGQGEGSEMDTEMEIKKLFACLAENPGTLKIAGFCARNAHRMTSHRPLEVTVFVRLLMGKYASDISDFAHASALPGYLGYDWADVLFYSTRGKRVFYCSCVGNERTMLN